MNPLDARYQAHVVACPRCRIAGASMVRCPTGRQLRREWIAAERAQEVAQ